MAGVRGALEEAFDNLGFDIEDVTDAITSDIDESGETESDGDGSDDVEPVGDVEDSEHAESDETEEDDWEEEDSEEPEENEDDSVVDGPVVIRDGVKVVLEDGTEVDGKDIIAFQSDYTKKTQSLSKERKEFEAQREQIVDAYNQMRDYYESRVKDPTNWVSEIAAAAEKPTAVLAGAIYDLAQQGVLDKQFVEAFGIDSSIVADVAKESKTEAELRQLREKLEKRELEEQEQARLQQTVARYQSEWAQIKQEHGLEFDTLESETEAKRELLTFATERKLTSSLVDAYDLMAARKQRNSPAGVASTAKQAKVQEPDPVVLEKKRASRAVAQQSASAGSAARKKARPKTTRAAALEALEEKLAAR